MNEFNGNSTPTTTKKRVYFADAVGLTLEFVKTIPPNCSDDAIINGEWNINNNYCQNMTSPRVRSRVTGKCLSPHFTEPYKTSSFLERVYSQNVCLESISCDDLVVTGCIRVTNMDFMKEVTVRFTLDNWKTYRDVWADFLSSNVEGKTDKFRFRITVPVDFAVDLDQKLEMKFAIRYCVGSQEFWDNNFNRNYRMQLTEICLP